MKKSFLYKGRQFVIDNSRRLETIGDFDENKDTIYVDYRMPERFLMGIAIHEIEERKWIRQGFSYDQAHLKAQKKELQFYKELKGSSEEGEKMLVEEERWVLKILIREFQEQLAKLGEEEFVKAIVSV